MYPDDWIVTADFDADMWVWNPVTGQAGGAKI